MDHASAWPVILSLGVWHGINPGMGWLFAVALGMQERRARAVWRALPPLALGHALAIAAAILLAAAAGMLVPLDVVRWTTAVVLVSAGLYRLRRHRHPRFGGMQMGGGDLVIWSLLMASAHGAGLMVVPFVLGDMDGVPGHAMHMASLMPDGGANGAFMATLVHTAGYLLVTGVVALVVYQKLGLRFLRYVWVNLDLVWAVALIVTGVLTPLL
jgi:hypothetical protein